MAGRGGLEPPPADPESAVLPLDDLPKTHRLYNRVVCVSINFDSVLQESPTITQKRRKSSLMKVLLYSENQKLFQKSGVGVALKHQMEALKRVEVDFTLNPKESFDIVHINTIGPGAWNLLKSSKRKGIPVIYHTHTTYEDFRNSFLFSNLAAPAIKRLLKKRYGTADYLIFPSKYTREIVRNYGVRTAGSVVSNGVDTRKFKRNQEYARKFLESFSIKQPVILNVGLPLKRKGINDFVAVAEKLPEYTFVWLGAKFSAFQPREVRNILKHPPENVLFPGYVPFEILLGALSAAAVFFFPSYEENEGIAVLEALSTECSVLIRNIPVYRDWMRSGKNCLKGNNVNEFADAILKLINDSSFAEELGKNGRKTAEERSLEKVGAKLKNIYEELLGGAL